MKDTSDSMQKDYYEAYWKHRISDDRLHTKEGTWIPQRITIAVEMIMEDRRANAVNSPTILDVGCGEGTIGKLLMHESEKQTKDGLVTYGCDISETVLEIAAPYYSEIYNVDIERGNFPEKFSEIKLDYIVVLDVLEHLFRPDVALEKCNTALNDGGVVITSFPNIAWYGYRVDILKGHFPSDYLFGSSDHIQQFTLFSFKDLLKKSGFKIEAIDGQFVLPKLFRPSRVFFPLCKRYPNLFGYQLVLKARKSGEHITPESQDEQI
jgi:2-polyprenyl-3-methyl-5-hydroxy-6-metoxy-1,4-benzoquinol methylase